MDGKHHYHRGENTSGRRVKISLMSNDDQNDNQSERYLTGQLLVAMPAMLDSRFYQTVIYVCVHSADGAMGLVVNRLANELTFPQLLQQLEVDTPGVDQEIGIHFGGPVESGRGFVLHSAEYTQDGTILVDDNICLTATIDILRDIADGKGPQRSLLALGYAGWGPGQLDNELTQNAWLQVSADNALIFGVELEKKWERAISKLGIDPLLLSDEAGHA
jgi:putative transcriptional regulator